MRGEQRAGAKEKWVKIDASCKKAAAQRHLCSSDQQINQAKTLKVNTAYKTGVIFYILCLRHFALSSLRERILFSFFLNF